MERHPLDVLSLLFGLLFTALATVGLLELLTLRVIDVRWIGPGLLVAFGIALVLTAGRGRPPRAQAVTAGPTVGDQADNGSAVDFASATDDAPAPAVDGPAVDGPAVDEPAVDEPAAADGDRADAAADDDRADT